MPITENMAWVFLKGRPQPYLAIHIPYQEDPPLVKEQSPDEIISGIDPMPYLLFDVQKLMQGQTTPINENFLKPITLPWVEGYSLYMDQIPSTFNNAQNLLKSRSLNPPLELTTPFKKILKPILRRKEATILKSL